MDWSYYAVTPHEPASDLNTRAAGQYLSQDGAQIVTEGMFLDFLASKYFFMLLITENRQRSNKSKTCIFSVHIEQFEVVSVVSGALVVAYFP